MRRNLLAIFLLIFVIASVSLLAKTFSRVPATFVPPVVDSPKPTLKLFTNLAKSFSFSYPVTWTQEPLSIIDNKKITAFMACDTKVLSITEVSAGNLTAEDYLGIKKNSVNPSIIDGYRAIVLSDEATASAVIEATSSGDLIEFQFHPSCDDDMTTVKFSQFFAILSYFKFL